MDLSQYNQLSTSEKICLNNLQTLGVSLTTMTLLDLTEHCQVSTATINRTLKKIGFANFKEFKHEYVKEISVDNTNNDFDNKLIDLIQYSDIDIAEHINKSSYIYIVAFGITTSLAMDFALHLKTSGYRCEVINDSDLLSGVVPNGNDELVIYISYSGHDIDMQMKAMSLKNMMTQILLTCTNNAKLAQYCNFVFSTDTSHVDGSLNSRIPLYILVTKIITQLNAK